VSRGCVVWAVPTYAGVTKTGACSLLYPPHDPLTLVVKKGSDPFFPFLLPEIKALAGFFAEVAIMNHFS